MDLSKLSTEEIEQCLKELRVLRSQKRAETPRAPQTRHDRKQRALKATRPKTKRKPRQGGGGGVSLQPAADSAQALEHVRKAIGSDWVDDPENPAVDLVSSESHLCARIVTYHERRWINRRIGDDNIIVIVRLKDGTEETRRFSRSVISATWKRS